MSFTLSTIKNSLYHSLSQSFSLKGRASRKEFLIFFIASCLYMLLVQFSGDGAAFTKMSEQLVNQLTSNDFSAGEFLLKTVYYQFYYYPLNIFQFILTPAYVCLCIRRLHDINRSGWFHLLPFTIVGLPLHIYWIFVKKSTEGENHYGLEPTI